MNTSFDQVMSDAASRHLEDVRIRSRVLFEGVTADAANTLSAPNQLVETESQLRTGISLVSRGLPRCQQGTTPQQAQAIIEQTSKRNVAPSEKSSTTTATHSTSFGNMSSMGTRVKKGAAEHELRKRDTHFDMFIPTNESHLPITSHQMIASNSRDQYRSQHQCHF